MMRYRINILKRQGKALKSGLGEKDRAMAVRFVAGKIQGGMA
jgi:hypothetical protein